MRRFVAGLIGLGLAISMAGVLGFRFNLTESLPPGVYRVTDASPNAGLDRAGVSAPPRSRVRSKTGLPWSRQVPSSGAAVRQSCARCRR